MYSGGADDTCNVCTAAVVANGPRAPATLGQRNLFRDRACKCFEMCTNFKKANKYGYCGIMNYDVASIFPGGAAGFPGKC